MQRMFQSATLKLTAWYLAILMTISVTFSIVIYQLNYQEVTYRLESLQHSIIDEFRAPAPLGAYFDNYFKSTPNLLLLDESRKASSQMIVSLLYINGVVLIVGGLGAYLLARRTLKPLEEAHEAQSRFTSDASHELRTPLSAMKAEIEVNLRDPKLEVGEARELLESNLEEVNKLIHLSETLLHLSRLDHGKLEVERIDLLELAHEAAQRYPSEAKRFDISSIKKTAVIANQASINEVIEILFDNARKYSPANSTIYVRIFTQRGSLGFEVRNKGKKIPDEVLPKLFDRFFRLDISRTNSARNGYGLGLSIAKKVIDVHHGDLTVSSTDEQTTFTFFLPIIRRN